MGCLMVHGTLTINNMLRERKRGGGKIIIIIKKIYAKSRLTNEMKIGIK